MSATAAAVAQPHFEDLLPKMSVQGYWETNEEPEIFREFLSDLTLDRVGGIASAGEVHFFALLPKVKKELVLVDHSYHSLAAFMFKLLLLKKLGAKGARELLTTDSLTVMVDAMKELAPQMPEVLSADLLSKLRANSFYSSGNVRREWYYAQPAALESSVKKLDKVTLLHADFNELAKRGPFDLVYLSNALEHSRCSSQNYNSMPAVHHKPIGSTQISLEEVEATVKPGGYVLLTETSTSYSGMGKKAGDTWTLVKSLKGFRTQWTYRLFQTPLERGSEVKDETVVGASTVSGNIGGLIFNRVVGSGSSY